MAVSLSSAARRPRKSEISSIAWVAEPDLAYDEWLRLGTRLGLTGRNAGWWIGDWVRYGTAVYGSKYTVAARVTGYDPQTLMNMVYVATRFETSRRRENLSWSHHAELAPFDVDEQEHWLDRATIERLSVRDLRELLADEPSDSVHARRRRTGRRGRALKRASADRRGADKLQRIVVCPHCGHRFAEGSNER
jgi:hypothetical protein